MTLLELPQWAEGPDETGESADAAAGPVAVIHPGQWRLARIEVLNWGTFDGLHRIDVARRGHLVTGASGSGKSSLLDAVATVLTPDRWLRFNAAAQDASARGDDRTLVSYVRGAWSKEADETLDRAISTYLRRGATWSGILLRFENQRDVPVTLARLFHLKGTSVDRVDLKDVCVVDRGDLEITDFEEFVAHGIEARRIKAAWPDAVITTSGSHGAFHARARRLLGIGSEHALHLLHKTQSAKNLGSLDHLFRTFMLDRPTTFERADNAVEQFGELNEAHRHVVDLRHQAEHLRGVAASISEYEREARTVTELERLTALIDVFQRRFALRLAEDARGELVAEHARADDAARRAEAERDAADEARREAERRELQLGGSDAHLLQARVEDAAAAAAATASRWAGFAEELASVGIDTPPTDATEFAELGDTARRALAEAGPASVHERPELTPYFEAKQELRRIDAELEALKQRKSNLPAPLLLARRELANALGLPESALPFGGELIEVLPEFAGWTGAIERVLHPIATALLVRDEHLPEVRRRVESRNLGARLVFEAVPPTADRPRPTRTPKPLLHRIRVSDGPFGDWLRWRLSSEFDVSCVDHPDEFDSVERGVTIGGQLKRSARRYVKDDRHAVDDRRHWVLGADNTAKVELLIAQRRDAERRHGAAEARLEHAQREANAAAARRGVFERVLRQAWPELDRAAADALLAERRRQFEAFTARSVELQDAVAAADAARSELRRRAGEAQSAGARLQIAAERLREVESQIAELTDLVAASALDETDAADLEARYRSVQRKIDRANVGDVGRKVSNALHQEVSAASSRRARAQAAFTEGAVAFATRWPAAAADLTTSIDDRAGYRAVLDGIESRGLPEHEENFLRLLREKSRDLIGYLLADIRDAPKQIAERIVPVNASLGRSQFDVDRYLRIDAKTRRTPEVDAFIADLKAVVDGNWSDDDVSNAERRFAVLERIMRRLGSSEHADRLWRQRCLDTREHVTFMAKEVDRGGRVVNVHDSSAGLSGGQRQKLVIFCLAAALRYQLTIDEEALPTYATIVLDEAFDKADSRYTRMAMDVFTEFGFHMILATPEKLLQTIEPYVGAVTSITNPSRKDSQIANLMFHREN